MRIAGFDVPFRLLTKPEVWVLTMDVYERGEGLSGGWAIKAYPTEEAANREKRLAENLMLGAKTFLIQNSDKLTRFELLERERVWTDLVEMLPKGFGVDGHKTVKSTWTPVLAVEKLDLP